MAPPLVAELMRGDEVGQVHIVLVGHTADEADAFREGHRVGERLREAAVARELHDAVLRELVRAVVGLVVVQPGA